MSRREPASAQGAASPRDLRLVVLLTALAGAVLSQFLFARAFGALPGAARDGWHVSLTLFGLLTLSGAALIWAVWRARHLPAGWGIGAAVIVAGILMRLPYFGTDPMLEDDHYRYLLDGAMVARGLNPYAHSPATLLGQTPPALAGLVEAGRNVIGAVNFPDLRTMYPGAAQAVFALAHWIAPWKIDGLRLVMFMAEGATALLIWLWLRRCGRPPLEGALYWCNPLMAFCLTGQAHIDAALAPPILLALFAASRNRGLAAGIALGLAVGVKLWPVLLAPLLARALWPDRRTLTAFVLGLGAMTLLTCGPLLWASLSAQAGLTAYAGGWSVNNAPFAWLSYLSFKLFGPGTGEMILRGAVVLIAGGASLYAGIRAPAGADGLMLRAALLAGLLFYLSPAQFPWYAAWFLPLAVASGAWVLTAGAVGLPVYYLFFPLAADGLRDLHGYGLAFLHLVPLLAALALHRRMRRGEETQ